MQATEENEDSQFALCLPSEVKVITLGEGNFHLTSMTQHIKMIGTGIMAAELTRSPRVT